MMNEQLQLIPTLLYTLLGSNMVDFSWLDLVNDRLVWAGMNDKFLVPVSGQVERV